MSEMFPIEQTQDHEENPKRREFERDLARRYDRLLDERRELLGSLQAYNGRDFNAILKKEAISDEVLSQIKDSWLGRVKDKTSFLEPLESLGIDIFAEKLGEQPGFPEMEITFNAEKILEQRMRSMRVSGGYASRITPEIGIAEAEPDIRSRLYHLLSKGTLDPTSSTLVHELVHRHHLRKNFGIDGVLTEAHAYFSGLLVAGPNFSMMRTADTLTRPESRGGLYEYDGAMVVDALAAVSSLYALGKTDAEISDLLSRSEFDWATKKFMPLEDEVQKLKEKAQIEDEGIDVMALYDVFRLHTFNERAKAQLLLYQTISDRIPVEELREWNRTSLRQSIAIPEYKIGDKGVPAEALLQNVICPADEEFPYDTSGQRTGVIFGFFTEPGMELRPGMKTMPAFGIGRWETEGKSGSVKLASTREEVDHYLDVVRTQARTMPFEGKRHVFLKYIQTPIMTIAPMSVDVLKVLFEKDEEKVELSHILESGYSVPIEHVLKEMAEIQRKASKLRTTAFDQKKVGAYEQLVAVIESMASNFDLDLAKDAPALTDLLRQLKEAISTVRSLN